jgi:hypothetical protein
MKKGLSRHWADFAEMLERDPGSRKWMSHCLGCGRAGLHADTPDGFWNRPWLEMLGRLPVDDRGLCQPCHDAEDARLASTGDDHRETAV